MFCLVNMFYYYKLVYFYILYVIYFLFVNFVMYTFTYFIIFYLQADVTKPQHGFQPDTACLSDWGPVCMMLFCYDANRKYKLIILKIITQVYWWMTTSEVWYLMTICYSYCYWVTDLRTYWLVCDDSVMK